MDGKPKRATKQSFSKLVVAIENGEDVEIPPNFDQLYRELEMTREVKKAAWWYHDKTSFDACYDAQSGEGLEPTWVSDKGAGMRKMLQTVSQNLHIGESREVRRQKRKEAALKRVERNAKHCLKTLQLIFKNKSNQDKSICELMLSSMNTKKNGKMRKGNTTTTSKKSARSSASIRGQKKAKKVDTRKKSKICHRTPIK